MRRYENHTYDTGQDRTTGELVSECDFVSDAILDDDECGATLLDDWLQLRCHVLLVDGLVGAYDVVYRRCLGG